MEPLLSPCGVRGRWEGCGSLSPSRAQQHKKPKKPPKPLKICVSITQLSVTEGRFPPGLGEALCSRGMREANFAGWGKGAATKRLFFPSPPPGEGGSRGVVAEVGRRKELKSKDNLKVERGKEFKGELDSLSRRAESRGAAAAPPSASQLL